MMRILRINLIILSQLLTNIKIKEKEQHITIILMLMMIIKIKIQILNIMKILNQLLKIKIK